jgi:hypothetical protein
MKQIISIFIIGLLLGCQSKNNDKFEKIDLPVDFPKEWYKLAETDSGYVIFNPCDAENRNYLILNDTLFVNGGHEVDKFLIDSIRRNQKDIYLFSTKNVLNNEIQPFYFTYVDYESGIANWKTTYQSVDFKTDFLFISNKDKENFITVNQPCVECWGDECEDSEKTFFSVNAYFEILNFQKINNYPSSMEDTSICKSWSLSEGDIEKIFQNSKPLSGPDWHHLFDHLPCAITGRLIQNDKTYDFSINGGSWLTVSNSDTSLMFANFNNINESLFLSTAWTEEDMEE